MCTSELAPVSLVAGLISCVFLPVFHSLLLLFCFSVKEDQYLNTNDFLDAVREEFERNWSKWAMRLACCLGSWYATRLGISNWWSGGDFWLCVCEIVNLCGHHLQYSTVHLDLVNPTVACYVTRSVHHLICNWNVAVAAIYLARCCFREYFYSCFRQDLSRCVAWTLLMCDVR